MGWFDHFLAVPDKCKPNVRYWMPHAVVSERGIARDLADIARRGFGGVEIVPMRACLTSGFFCRENLWGSDAWLNAMKILLREAKKNGLTVDFANGPAWPIANIHAKDGSDETTIYELSYGLKILAPGETYEGEIPRPAPDRESAHQKLLSLALYRISGEKQLDMSTYRPLPLDATVSLTAPDDGDYALFAYFEKPSGRQHLNSGCFYVIDHFSRRGADAAMDFWEYEALPRWGEDADVIRSIFCDSLEYITNLDWTRGFESIFKQKKGYDILPYLPCLGPFGPAGTDDRNKGVFPPTNVAGYTLDDADLFCRVNHDYMDVLNDLYCHEHLARMQERAAGLGWNIRYQVAYNKLLEAESSALYVGIPENEPLGRPVLDNFRIMAAAVNLDRKRVYSFECAAEKWNAYGQTHEDILWWAKRSYLGGMNFQVLHGAEYCGYFEGEGSENGVAPGIRWPGFHGFHDPLWTNAWNRTPNVAQQAYLLRYLARCNYLLQSPHKVDLAVYRHEYSNHCPVGTSDGDYILRDGNALNNAGYTYEFFSPSLMDHPNARVLDGVLDPEGAAYRAMIVNGEEYMDFRGAEHLLAYKRAGLPVLFVARKPDKCYFASEAHTDAELCALIDALDAPVIEDIRDIPRVLEAMGILPDAKPSKPSPVRSVHVKVQRADFYYLYNTHTVYNVSRPETIYPRIDKSVCMCEFDACFSLAGKGEVYELDAFDGKVKRLPSRTVGERTEVQLSFARDEAKIIAVLTAEQAKALGVKGELAPALHPSGERILRDWTVTVERIKAPENPASTFYESMWEKQAPVRTDALRPWNELCEAWNEWSGNATYETSFSLDEVPKLAILKIEQVCDTYEVWVNGIPFAQGDPVRHETDITAALARGENTLRFLVAGTLKNAASLDFIRRAAPPDRPKTAQRQGMWGQIKLELYE